MNLFDVYTLFDIEIEKALGSKLWDKEGTEYLDLYGGHAVISIGHTHPQYVKNISDQLHKIGFYSNSIKIKLQEELAHKLAKLSGCDDYNLFLCNSGAEANENAFKVASFHNNRKKIIAFQGSFHGRTSLAVSATDNPTIIAPVNANSNVEFLPFNDIKILEEKIDDTVSAVIIEGVQGVAGIYTPTAEFLQKIEYLCNKHNVLFIVDEVQSGYGRTGKFFAHQWANVKPDIITTAKGMGNGFPVAGVLIKNKYESKKEMLGTTFGGNYLACTAAISVLDVLENEQLIENANIMGQYVKDKLNSNEKIKEIRGEGLMIGIELFEECKNIRTSLLHQYKIFTGTASNKNTLRILPALTISKSEIDYFVQSLLTLLA